MLLHLERRNANPKQPRLPGAVSCHKKRPIVIFKVRLGSVAVLVPTSPSQKGDAVAPQFSGRRHPFTGKLFDRFFALGEMGQAHSPQNVVRLGEVNVVVGDDL